MLVHRSRAFAKEERIGFIQTGIHAKPIDLQTVGKIVRKISCQSAKAVHQVPSQSIRSGIAAPDHFGMDTFGVI